MSGSETVIPEELTSLANRLASNLQPLFEQAQTQLEGTEVGGPSFSKYGLDMQAIYPTVQQFAMRDLQTKSQNIASIIERLGKTAKTWEETESKNTITAGGPVGTE